MKSKTFIGILLTALILLFSSCSTSMKIDIPERTTYTFETMGVSEELIGEIDYITHSYWTKSKSKDLECPKITTLYCKKFEGDQHPTMIRLCGNYHMLQHGDKVWIYKSLPTNYHDYTEFAIIHGFKYPLIK